MNDISGGALNKSVFPDEERFKPNRTLTGFTEARFPGVLPCAQEPRISTDVQVPARYNGTPFAACYSVGRVDFLALPRNGDFVSGFARLTAEVALARVGLVLGLEVSRLARNNAEWYRLIDLAGLTDTLIGDGDGLYHPAVFNDRLLLGVKGTMSEAEFAHTACAPQWRHSQQGGARRTPARPARRLCLGRGGGRGLFSP